jgi:hypothetical protein
MAFNRISSRAAAALPLIGIVLALANWNARPDRPRAWTGAVVMLLVMVAVRQGWQIASRHSSTVTQYAKRTRSTSEHAHGHDGGDPDAACRRDADVVKAALARTVAFVDRAVVFGALMMIISLTMTLANAYGLVERSTMLSRAILIVGGAFLVVMGNGMPRALPPVTLRPRLDARVQAFQRFAGWTWVLCGLAFVTASLALPINTARPVVMALVGAAVIVTVLQCLRLVRLARQHVPGLD